MLASSIISWVIVIQANVQEVMFSDLCFLYGDDFNFQVGSDLTILFTKSPLGYVFLKIFKSSTIFVNRENISFVVSSLSTFNNPCWWGRRLIFELLTWFVPSWITTKMSQFLLPFTIAKLAKFFGGQGINQGVHSFSI